MAFATTTAKMKNVTKKYSGGGGGRGGRGRTKKMTITKIRRVQRSKVPWLNDHGENVLDSPDATSAVIVKVE